MTTSKLDAAFTFAANGDWPRVVPAARQALASDPEDANAHALLALGLAHVEQAREAVEAGRRAVALDPELSFAHYAHGWALLEYDDSKGAERAARAALRLQPGADEHALLAQVHSRQRRWKEALDIAERGLALEPEHQSCANFRALALTNLGQTAAATGAVHLALASDPDDAYSHANRGWILLRESRVEEALDSFRTALRLDPTMDWARLGIIEAMKARKGVYRLIMRYSLWTSSLSTQARWFLIIGLYFGSRTVRSILRENPTLLPILGPALAAYGVFVFGSWIADPLSNLFLRLNPVGRLALTRFETAAANVVGVCLALAIVSGLVFITTRSTPWLVLAVVCALLLIPIGGAVTAHGTRAWRPMAIAAGALAACGAGAVILSLVHPASGGVLLAVLFVSAFAWSWIANYLFTKYQ
jgi:tetratricopeptide (TPR) repeat protein